MSDPATISSGYEPDSDLPERVGGFVEFKGIGKKVPIGRPWCVKRGDLIDIPSEAGGKPEVYRVVRVIAR